MSVGKIINPGIGLDMNLIQQSEVTIAEKTSFADTLLNIIPKNPIGALANGEMLPIILFAIIVGIILAGMGESAETVGNFFSQFNDVMMKMTIGVMKFAPFGVFCLIAKTFSGIGFDAFVPLLKYMFAVVFAAQAFGVTLTPTDYITVIATATLASIGTAGVPGVGLITLSMVFASVGLPVEGIALIMGIDRILDMSRTAVNITGDAVCTTIVAHQDGLLNREVFNTAD